MPSYCIARILKIRQDFTCEMCGKHRMAKMYEYKSQGVVKGYVHRHYKRICGDCIYKEVYGSKTCRIMKKEKTLDDM